MLLVPRLNRRALGVEIEIYEAIGSYASEQAL